jgi:hypothetical protein
MKRFLAFKDLKMNGVEFTPETWKTIVQLISYSPSTGDLLIASLCKVYLKRGSSANKPIA